MITYSSEGIKMPRIRKRDITRWIKTVASDYGKITGEIGYLFVSDEKILEGNTINGDIIISLDTVRSNAELFKKEFKDELHRVIIHGILHLCGINDKGPGEREKMEACENKALTMLINSNQLK